jgi:hypothetical protein
MGRMMLVKQPVQFMSKKPFAMGLNNYYVQQIPTQIAWIYGHDLVNESFAFEVFTDDALDRN